MRHLLASSHRDHHRVCLRRTLARAGSRRSQRNGVTSMTDGSGAPAGRGAAPKPAAPSGPGSAGDFVDPFANALLAAATAVVQEPAGDPDIIAVFKLGWLMGEILA